MIEFITALGAFSLSYIWIPLGLWTLMAIPLFIISRYLGNRHPAIHYHGAMALLLSLPIGFLLMPLLAVNLSLISVPDFALLESKAPVEAPPVRIEAAPETTVFSVPPVEPFSTAPEVLPPATNYSWGMILGWITVLAGLLSILSLVVLGLKTYKLNMLRRLLIPVEDKDALDLVSTLEAQFNIKRPVALLLVPTSLGPMTFGGIRPVIGIPEHLLEEPDVLKSVLYHEFIHVKRFDYVTGWIVRCIQALFVFHPVVHLLARQVSTYRELSCDAAFLEEARLPPAAYARLLFRFSKRVPVHCSVPMVQKSSTLKKRIKNMSNPVSPNPFSNKAVVSAVLLFLFVPALFVACSSGASETDEETVLRLEAQVEYLRAEINNNLDILNQITEHNSTLTSRDDPDYNPNGSYYNQRSALLRGMLTQKMQQLEEARMEAATDEWIKKVKE